METLQYSEHNFGEHSCITDINFVTNGTLYIQEVAVGENENLKIFAMPGILEDLEIVLENGELSVKCSKASKDNFFGILKIKKIERLLSEQPKDWFCFNKDAEIFIFGSLLPGSSDNFVSKSCL